ncbi:MAG: pilus assembly protein PilP [Gammaproteobacteria bacterium]
MNRPGQHIMAIMKETRVILLLGAAIVLSGCGSSEMSDLENYVRQVKAREGGGIEPLPVFKPVEPFVFNPSNLRNPFVPSDGIEEPIAIAAQNGIHPDTLRPREELESYSLDSLRMVGTLEMAANLWGLIQANDGTIHRVRNGNYMGQNHGKIIRILENQIELLEIIPDAPGSWRENQASVKLSESNG